MLVFLDVIGFFLMMGAGQPAWADVESPYSSTLSISPIHLGMPVLEMAVEQRFNEAVTSF